MVLTTVFSILVFLVAAAAGQILLMVAHARQPKRVPIRAHLTPGESALAARARARNLRHEGLR